MFVIVVGGGRIGFYLTKELLAEGHELVLMEKDPRSAERIRDELGAVVVNRDGCEGTHLAEAGANRASIVAAVTGDDADNLVVCQMAKHHFDVPRTIARVNNPENAWMFTADMGVDVALSQADIFSRLIAEEMSLGDMMTLLKLRKGQFSVIEEKVHPQAVCVGKALGSMELPEECVITAIIRKGDLIVPRGDVVRQPADEIIAVVHASQLGQLAALLGPANRAEAERQRAGGTQITQE